MPRGSKPGERRGGRARGTPNKSTVFKDAVFCAAAQPNTSPLDFMLAVMRNEEMPTDLRIEMAAAAAPFVHTRPKADARKRADPAADRSRLRDPADIIIRRAETNLSASESGVGDEANLTPLDYLLGVMTDPEVTSRQRINAARIAARYKHTHPRPDEMPIVIEDPFGFSFDPAMARALRDNKRRALRLDSERRKREQGATGPLEPGPEEVELKARIDATEVTLRCPAGYGERQAMKDRKRLRNLASQRAWPPPNNILTAEEDAEEMHLTARVAAYDWSPEAKAVSRITELSQRRIVRQGLTAAEQSELDDLCKQIPVRPKDPDEPEDPLAPVLEAAMQALKKHREQNTQGSPRQKPARPSAR
jgi:hypothetical protein